MVVTDGQVRKKALPYHGYLRLLKSVLNLQLQHFKLTPRLWDMFIRGSLQWWPIYHRAMFMSMIGARILPYLLELCTIVFVIDKNRKICNTEVKKS